MKSRIPGRACAVLALAAVSAASLTSAARAADIRWSNSAGGTFSLNSNWLGNLAPLSGDIADFGVVTSGNGPAYVVNFTSTPTNQGLVVHRDAVTLNLSGFNYTLTGVPGADSVIVGQATGESGTLTLTGGTLTTNATSTAFQSVIGQAAGATGVVVIGAVSPATWIDNAEERIGESGTGVLNQFGGTHTLAANLLLGVSAGSTGTYNLNGISAVASVAGSMFIGGNATAAGGTGIFNLSAGAITVASTLKIWNTPGSALNLSGGSLTLFALDTNGNPSHFNWTAGVLKFTGAFAIDANNPLGPSLTIGASKTLIAVTDELVGSSSAGTITQTGGVHSVGTFLDLGENTGGAGTYVLSGGTLSAGGTGGNGSFWGRIGSASFTQTGGVDTFGDIVLGQQATGSGTATLNDPASSATFTANILTAGQNGNGTLNVMSGIMTLGMLSISATRGVANLSGGTLSVGALITNGAANRFNWTAGTFKVTGASGLLISSAGPLGATPTLTDGKTLTVTNTLSINAGGTLSMTGGTLDPLANMRVGDTSAGTFNQSGGSLALTSTLFVGALAGSAGTINLSVNAGLGGSGTLDVGGNSSASGGTGVVTITPGGALFPNTLKIWNNPNAAVNLSGGFLSFTTLDTDGNPSHFHWTSGFLQIATSPNFNIGTGPLGSLINVDNGKQFFISKDLFIDGSGQLDEFGDASFISVSQSERIGNTGAGEVDQSGGTHRILINNGAPGLILGALTGSTGTYSLSGGTLTVSFPDTGSTNFIGGNATAAGGTGVLNISGGIAAINGILKIWNTAGSAINLSGGELDVADLDTNGVPAHFNWTAGTFNILFLTLNSTASLGSSLSLVTGKTLTVDNELDIPAGGLLTLSGGTLNVFVLDTFGVPSHLSWTTGTLNITNVQFSLAPSGPIGASLTLGPGKSFGVIGLTSTFSGDFFPGTLTLTPGSSLNLSGGTLHVNALDTGGDPSRFNWTAGTLIIDNLSIGQGGVIGNSLSLASKSLQTSGTITNNSSIDLAGGSILGTGLLVNPINQDITGPGQLVNTPAGLISGPGTIQIQFTNNGMISLASGALILPDFTNNGLIELAGPSANLAPGANITNAGTLEGFGRVSATLTNNGTIEATGGNLSFVAPLVNSPGGTMRVATGNKILVQGAANFPTNAGLLSLAGGTFDNGGQPLNNTGQITGFGILATGGLTNSGTITLSGGTSTVNGDVINTSGHAIDIKFAPAIFTGNVTNQPGGTIKSFGTSVTFAGTYTGSFTSDPADNFFQSNLTTNPGDSISGGAGDRFFLQGGAFHNAGTFANSGTLQSDVPIDNSGFFSQTGTFSASANFSNSGTAIIGGTQTWSPGLAFTNSGGTTTFLTNPTGAAAPLGFSLTGGRVNFWATAAPRKTSTVLLNLQSLSLTAGATLDASNHDLLIGNSSLATIESAIKAGFNLGSPPANSPAITSSSAAPGTTFLVPLDADAMLGDGTPGSAIGRTFDGVAIQAAATIIIKYTYIGDVTLDGTVDGLDYATAVGHFGQSTPGLANIQNAWLMGDINFDGTVNAADLSQMAANMDASASLSFGAVDLISPSSGSTAIPEPASLSCMACGAFLLLTRRRFKGRHL